MRLHRLSGPAALACVLLSTACGTPRADDVPVVAESQTAPDFTLPTADGTAVSLADRLADGPVVLVFYRGHW